LERKLFENAQLRRFAQLVRMPSFAPESATFIVQQPTGEFELVHRQARRSNSGEWDGLQTGSTAIPIQDAKLLSRIWSCAIRDVRYPTHVPENTPGPRTAVSDGTRYLFTTADTVSWLGAEAREPRKGSLAAAMVALSELMAELVDVDDHNKEKVRQ